MSIIRIFRYFIYPTRSYW